MEPSGEEAVEIEAKPKRGKADEPLTLQQCVTMSAADIEKLDKAKQTKMKNLYSGAFEPLYKWGGEKLKDDKGNDVTVHFSRMHRAPQGSIVYRGLIEERLKALTNQARINPRTERSQSFHSRGARMDVTGLLTSIALPRIEISS